MSEQGIESANGDVEAIRRDRHAGAPPVERLIEAVEAYRSLIVFYLVVGVCSLVFAVWLVLAHTVVFAAFVVSGVLIGALTGGLIKMRVLRDHEVGLIHGRWFGGRDRGKTRIVWQGRPLVLLGEELIILSVGIRTVDFTVPDCISQDNVAVGIELVGTFSIQRDEASILAVSRTLRCDEQQMARRVKVTVAEQVRGLLTGITAAQVHGRVADVGTAALRWAAPSLLELGLVLHDLNVGAVKLPERYLAMREDTTLLGHAADQRAAQRLIDRADAEEVLRLEGEKSRAATDEDRYAQDRNLDIIERRMSMDRHHQAEIDKLERIHAEALDKSEIEKVRLKQEIENLKMESQLAELRGRLEAQSEHARTIAMQEIIKQLPQIYAAKNQILPNLKNIFGGSDGGSNIFGLIERIAAVTPDVMPEIKGILDTVLGRGGPRGSDLFGLAGPPREIPGHSAETTQPLPVIGPNFGSPPRLPHPGARPSYDRNRRP